MKEVKKTSNRGTRTLYKPEYCQELIDFMSKGYSFEAFAAHVGVSCNCTYQWVKANPEFAEAKERAFEHSRLFWERCGIEGMFMEKGFNATVWIFNMKNRFGWRDAHKVELETKDADKMSKEEILAELEQIKKELK
jgi:hypothetical protein